jgi:ketosteroid isomerase-like protein
VNRNEKQAWMDTWDGPIDRESRDFTITVSGDLAVGHGYFRLHEHTSVPFYMDGSLRPAFDLEP